MVILKIKIWIPNIFSLNYSVLLPGCYRKKHSLWPKPQTDSRRTVKHYLISGDKMQNKELWERADLSKPIQQHSKQMVKQYQHRSINIAKTVLSLPPPFVLFSSRPHHANMAGVLGLLCRAHGFTSLRNILMTGRRSRWRRAKTCNMVDVEMAAAAFPWVCCRYFCNDTEVLN